MSSRWDWVSFRVWILFRLESGSIVSGSFSFRYLCKTNRLTGHQWPWGRSVSAESGFKAVNSREARAGTCSTEESSTQPHPHHPQWMQLYAVITLFSALSTDLQAIPPPKSSLKQLHSDLRLVQKNCIHWCLTGRIMISFVCEALKDSWGYVFLLFSKETDGPLRSSPQSRIDHRIGIIW